MILPFIRVLTVHAVNTYSLQSEQYLRDCLETVTDMQAFLERHRLSGFQIGSVTEPVTGVLLTAIHAHAAQALEDFHP